MAEYLVSVVVMSLTLGFITYASYSSSSTRAVKFAASVLLLYTVLTPMAALIGTLDESSFDSFFGDTGGTESEEQGAYLEVAEESFKDGICKLLFTKYGIEAGNVDVVVYGFDFKSMSAEKVKIILSGSDIFADWRGIGAYISECGLGECEVVLDFG